MTTQPNPLERHFKRDFIPLKPDVVQALLEEVQYEELLLLDYVMCIGYR
jgi:hypothetical protein